MATWNNANDANTVLLITFDVDFSDSSVGHTSTHTPTLLNSPTIVSSPVEFGAGSGLLSANTNMQVSYPNSNDFQPTGDFTIDFWAYPTVSAGNFNYVTKQNVAGFGPYDIIYNGGTWQFYSSTNGTSWTTGPVSFGTAIQNTWQHIAVVASGGTFYCYFNGTATNGGSVGTISNSFSTQPLVVGPLTANIDELDFALVARVAGGASFSVPTTPYAAFVSRPIRKIIRASKGFNK